MYDPWDEIGRMHQEMDRMFASFFRSTPLLAMGRQGLPAKQADKDLRTPLCDVRETETTVQVRCELPGVEKKDLDVNVTETAVEIKAERKIEKEVKKDKSYSYSAASSSFYRVLPLPAKVMPDKTVATYENGMLSLTIPKERAEKKRIGHKIKF